MLNIHNSKNNKNGDRKMSLNRKCASANKTLILFILLSLSIKVTTLAITSPEENPFLKSDIRNRITSFATILAIAGGIGGVVSLAGAGLAYLVPYVKEGVVIGIIIAILKDAFVDWNLLMNLTESYSTNSVFDLSLVMMITIIYGIMQIIIVMEVYKLSKGKTD